MKFASDLSAAALGLLVLVGSSPVLGQRGRPGPARPVPRGVVTGPVGGVQSGAVRGGTVRGPGGTTVQRVGGGAVSRGPLGGVSGVGGSATRVTGPGGNSVTRVQGGGGAVGPAGGVRVGGGSGTVVRTPGGTAAAGQRGGVAVGPVGGVRGGAVAGGAVRTPFGTAGAVTRSGIAAGPGGTVRVGHATRFVSPAAVRGSAVVVRGGFRQPVLTPTWFRGHPAAWVAPRWAVGGSPWRPAAWAPLAAFVGVPGPPVAFDYGTTVLIQDDVVYANGDRVAAADEYAAQAAGLADLGRQARPAADDEWQPLGVFGLVREDEAEAQRVFQLAVNKAGVIRGNYVDLVSDSDLPVTGSVDRATQRAAWSVGGKSDVVFETGLSNFTKDESAVLVHYGTASTRQMILVRLDPPEGGN